MLSDRDHLVPDSGSYSVYDISDLELGQHTCCIHENREKRKEVIRSFLQEGFRSNHKIIYVVREAKKPEVRDQLEQVIASFESLIGNGQLELLGMKDVFLREGSFNPDYVIKLLRAKVNEALSNGFSGLRLTSDMAWVKKTEISSEKLIEYESKLNRVFSEQEALGLCQYDRNLFEPDVLLDALRAHPTAIIDGKLYENFHHVPASSLLEDDGDRAELRAWEEGLKKSRKKKRDLKHKNSLLKSIRKVNQIIVEEDGIEEIMKRSVESLLATRDYRSVNMALLDEKTGEIRPRFQKGDHDFRKSFSIGQDGEGDGPPCVREVVKSKKPGSVPMKDCEACSYGKPVHGASTLAVPLVRDKVVGVLHVWFDSQKVTLGKEEEELLVEVAGDLALAWGKVKAEEHLRKTREQFRNIVQGSPYPMMVHAEDGEILMVNGVWSDLTGYDTGEVNTVAEWTRKAFGDDTAEIRSDIEELFRLGERHDEGEYELSTKDGEVRVWDFSSAPLGELPDGRRIVLSAAHDVTNRRKLERTQELFSSSLNQAAVEVYWIKPDGELAYTNKKVEEELGYSKSELEQMRISEIAPYLERHERSAQWESVKENRVINFEGVHGRKDGTEFPVEITSHYVQHGGKEYELVFAKDITERKKNEGDLKKYREIVEQLDDPVMLQDLDGNYIMMNGAVPDYAGVSRERLIGRDEREFMDKETYQEIRINKEEVLETEQLHEYDISPRLEGKGEKHFSTSRFPFYDENGELIGTGAICMDVTEREATRQELQESEARLRQSFIKLAETTSRVLGVRDPYTESHELRVGEIAREVGERLGLSKEKQLGLYLGGVLHDIGKIAVPETILTKPGELKDVEWRLIKSHPEVGYNQILEDTDFPWPVAEMTLHHHERLDGSGYPDGLEGNELSLEVRILGAVDVAEAMSTRRPYREARSRETVLSVLQDGSGTKFDPEIIELLVDMIREGGISFGE